MNAKATSGGVVLKLLLTSAGKTGRKKGVHEEKNIILLPN